MKAVETSSNELGIFEPATFWKFSFEVPLQGGVDYKMVNNYTLLEPCLQSLAGVLS